MNNTNSPIFIIGAARSGTKFLRSCLDAHPDVYSVPHDVNYVWRYQQDVEMHDELDASQLTDEQKQYIQRTLIKMANVPANGILLEKTVSNTLRVPMLESVFPNARYVHLIRDGRDVSVSAMREWSAPMDYKRILQKLRSFPLGSASYLFWYAKNWLAGMFSAKESTDRVWGPRYKSIAQDVKFKTLAQVCALQWKHSLEKASQDLLDIDQSRVFSIHYEDLVSNTEAISTLARQLQLDDSEAIVEFYRSNVRPGSGKKSAGSEVQTRKDIELEVQDTLNAFGYTAE